MLEISKCMYVHRSCFCGLRVFANRRQGLRVRGISSSGLGRADLCVWLGTVIT